MSGDKEHLKDYKCFWLRNNWPCLKDEASEISYCNLSVFSGTNSHLSSQIFTQIPERERKQVSTDIHILVFLFVKGGNKGRSVISIFSLGFLFQSSLSNSFDSQDPN